MAVVSDDDVGQRSHYKLPPARKKDMEKYEQDSKRHSLNLPIETDERRVTATSVKISNIVGTPSATGSYISTPSDRVITATTPNGTIIKGTHKQTISMMSDLSEIASFRDERTGTDFTANPLARGQIPIENERMYGKRTIETAKNKAKNNNNNNNNNNDNVNTLEAAMTSFDSNDNTYKKSATNEAKLLQFAKNVGITSEDVGLMLAGEDVIKYAIVYEDEDDSGKKQDAGVKQRMELGENFNCVIFSQLDYDSDGFSNDIISIDDIDHCQQRYDRATNNQWRVHIHAVKKERKINVPIGVESDTVCARWSNGLEAIAKWRRLNNLNTRK